MKKLITLTAALLMTTQVFATNDPLSSNFDQSGQTKCLSFKGKVNDKTSIKVTSNGSKLDGVDITVQSHSTGKDGTWTPLGDQEWDISLLYKGPEYSVPFTVEVENVGTTNTNEGPNFYFNDFKDCKN